VYGLHSRSAEPRLKLALGTHAIKSGLVRRRVHDACAVGIRASLSGDSAEGARALLGESE
jgi:hypothetical protein